AWDLGGNMGDEIDRAMLLGVLPPERVAQLYPPYPGDRNPYITAAAGTSDDPANPTFTIPAGATDALRSAGRAIEALDDLLLGGEETGIGSNSWVVGGSLSPTGMPLIANDPHLGSQMPSIWYQVGLHCRIVDDACPIDVAGFSFAGVPGVIIGHNADIAWAFTNTGPDVQDLYIEKVNPENPDQYEVNGEWVDMDVRIETIEVGGGDPIDVAVRSTRHGPIISDSYEPLEDFDAAGVDTPDPYAIALRWTALDEIPSLFTPIFSLNTARDWSDFRAAGETFGVPAQNLLYADTSGNIGYQMPGTIPIRRSGDGTIPVPGWTDDHEWTGFVPYAQLPHVVNPETDWIVTANNAVIAEDFPYLITRDWDYGYRARRIVDLVTSNPGLDVDGFATLQFDSYDLNAEYILPYLENALVVVQGVDDDANDDSAINQLFRWDLQNFAGSTGAAIWNATWSNLLRITFEGDVPEESMPAGNSRWFEVMRTLLQVPDDPFWDDPVTQVVEERDDILVRAFHAAVDELEASIGTTVSDWTWGAIHTMTFRNQSLGDTGIGLIDDRFNRGPYPASGSKGIVNAVGWSADEGYEVDWLPSMRMVVDLDDLSRSTAVHTTGQSGHTDHPHYDDMIPAWLAGETYPMLWTRDAVVADTEARLVLVP
ncbi:MAG: penicillin acylase family protein, partial [Acidimicrobiia bacterium]|nr:penicillin acylase family protein [Acidimicrobiia bacterium]